MEVGEDSSRESHTSRTTSESLRSMESTDLKLAPSQNLPRSSSTTSLSSLYSNSSTTDKICHFYTNGLCRNGDSCKFKHVDTGSAAIRTLPAPAPVIVQVPQGHPIFSIDVECVATGVQHNARSVAQVALVDEWQRPIFNVLISQDVPVVSYLTPLTGLTKELIDAHGIPLAEAMAMLRAHLPPNSILVGQNILKDVRWLQLIEGVDYHSIIDLVTLYRVWDSMKGNFITFSQDHCANVVLGLPQRPHHNAIEDACISVALFNAYRSLQWDINQLMKIQAAMLSSPRIPGFSSLYPVLDGCCMGNRKKCICSTPFTDY